MNMRVMIILALVMVGIVAGAGEYHRHFHIHQTSLTSFVVTCDNGADPTLVGSKDKMALEISCGK